MKLVVGPIACSPECFYRKSDGVGEGRLNLLRNLAIRSVRVRFFQKNCSGMAKNLVFLASLVFGNVFITLNMQGYHFDPFQTLWNAIIEVFHQLKLNY